MANKKPLVLTNGKIEQIQSGDVIDPAFYTAGSGGSANAGTATVDFTTFRREASVSVTGQTGILSTSKITASIFANTDDVYANDWYAVIIKNIIAGTGFTIVLRVAVGDFKGTVSVNWTWS